jgi:hypothetical protein
MSYVPTTVASSFEMGRGRLQVGDGQGAGVLELGLAAVSAPGGCTGGAERWRCSSSSDIGWVPKSVGSCYQVEAGEGWVRRAS